MRSDDVTAYDVTRLHRRCSRQPKSTKRESLLREDERITE